MGNRLAAIVVVGLVSSTSILLLRASVGGLPIAVPGLVLRESESSQAGVLDTSRDERLRPNELVLGVLQPAARAYALADVARHGRIWDTLAGETVEVVWNPASRTASAFRVLGEERSPLPATPVSWLAWVDLVPGAPLWRPVPPGQRRPYAETSMRLQ